MRLSRDGKLIRTDAWREGKYLDLWSVPHFLSGMVVALPLYFFEFDIRSASIIAFLIFVAYEMFEVIAKIDETRWNRILDVVVGMVSFTPTFLLAVLLTRDQIIVMFVVIAAVDIVLSVFGWRASQKAAVLEETLRSEIEKERERFADRRAAISKRWHHRHGRL